MTLNEHIISKLDCIVYSRYGYDYIFQFQPGNSPENYPIGSHRINLDYLIYQKQKMLTSDERGSYVISRPNVLSQRMNVSAQASVKVNREFKGYQVRMVVDSMEWGFSLEAMAPVETRMGSSRK